MWTQSPGAGTDKNYQGTYEDGIADDWNNNMNYPAAPPPCLCYGNHFPVPMPPPVGIPYMPSYNNMYSLPQPPIPYEYFQPNLAFPMYQQQHQQAFSNSDRSDYGDWQQQIDYQTKLKEQQLQLLKKQTMLVEQNLVANQRRNSMMQQHLVNRVRSNTIMYRSNSLPVNARSSMTLNRRSSIMTIDDTARNSAEMVSRVHHLKSMITALKNKIHLERTTLMKEKLETESHYRLRHAPKYVEERVLFESPLEMKESPSRTNVVTPSDDMLTNYGKPPSFDQLVRTVDLTVSPLEIRLSPTITDVSTLPPSSVTMRQQEEQLKKRSVAVIAQAMSYKNKLAEIERRCNEELNNVQKSLSSIRESSQLRRQSLSRVGNTKSEMVTDTENKQLQAKQAKSHTDSPTTTTHRKKRISPRRNKASVPVRKGGSTAAITCEYGADGSLITSAVEDSEHGSKHSISQIRNYSASSESISSSICDRL